MFEHLRRSYNYIPNHLGPHGLPLIGRADWNDCLNLNCFSEEPGESFQTFSHPNAPDDRVAESVLIAGMFVAIGPELSEAGMQDCSLVTVSYRVGGGVGTMGVIGPTRMDYSKVLQAVRMASRTLSDD